MDVIDDFAYPLPALVICELMGVPLRRPRHFKGWSGEVAPILDPWSPRRSGTRRWGRSRNFGIYFWQLIEERRQDPQDDLLSAR